MKRLIQKIIEQKKLGLTIVFLFFLLIIYSIYALTAVHGNVEKMQKAETVSFYPSYPAVTVKPGQNAELIKRGQYLVTAGDCIACHTNTAEKEKAKPFAGGLAMPTPFGTIYAPNLTPDKETGIGNWSEEDFIKAMREGISPKGHYYYPAFPYLYFSKLSTDDLKAIKAYLDVIPAVHQENQKNDMVFPFNIRFLQLGWRILFFYPEHKEGEFKNDPQQSALWNRGAYLAEGLGHCAMCHSPSYHLVSENLSLGAPIRKYDLTGSKIQGFLAPNITQANLSKISINEIIDVFTQDRMIGGGRVEGPMLEANHDSLRYLTHSDLEAVATYLKAVHSEEPPKPKAGAGGIGASIYDTYCSGCHATGSGGAPKFGDAGAWDPIMKPGIDKVYMHAIQGVGGMPAKGTCISCSEDEIKQAVDYMIAATKGGAGGETVVSIPKMKTLTLTDGQRVYDENCSVCHKSGFKNAPIPGDKAAWQPLFKSGFLDIYQDVLTGNKGHPIHGACPKCTDGELKAAIKYMLHESTSANDYNLW